MIGQRIRCTWKYALLWTPRLYIAVFAIITFLAVRLGYRDEEMSYSALQLWCLALASLYSLLRAIVHLSWLKWMDAFVEVSYFIIGIITLGFIRIMYGRY